MGLQEGDIVATRGEPGFADYYNAKMGTFVKVPKVDKKYILEPVACGINVANAVYTHNEDYEQSIAIIGTGFLARVTHYTLKRKGYKNFTVCGNAYPEYWDRQGVIKTTLHNGGGFDAFIDFSSKQEYMTGDFVNDNGLYVLAAEKTVENMDFSKYLWRNITIKCPSPRDKTFIQSMRYARECIKSNSLKVSDMWEMGYNRMDAKQAFEYKVNGYHKGRVYLTWD
jgi:threonine dehydrogenase-like Zn-dependent dehydrogenase